MTQHHHRDIFGTGAFERPYHFPYRIYSDPELLDVPALREGPVLELARGDVISSEDHARECFLVVEGALASLVGADEAATQSAFYLPGSLFFELSALALAPAALEYRALEDCTLRRIPAEALKQAMMADEAVFDRVIRSICSKMYAAREQQRGAKLLDVRERVYLMLLGFASDRGTAAEDGWVTIDWKLTQQDIGDMLGVNRVTVSNAMRELTDRALVRKGAGRYQVRDVTGLLDVR